MTALEAIHLQLDDVSRMAAATTAIPTVSAVVGVFLFGRRLGGEPPVRRSAAPASVSAGLACVRPAPAPRAGCREARRAALARLFCRSSQGFGFWSPGRRSRRHIAGMARLQRSASDVAPLRGSQSKPRLRCPLECLNRPQSVEQSMKCASERTPLRHPCAMNCRLNSGEFARQRNDILTVRAGFGAVFDLLPAIRAVRPFGAARNLVLQRA